MLPIKRRREPALQLDRGLIDTLYDAGYKLAVENPRGPESVLSDDLEQPLF